MELRKGKIVKDGGKLKIKDLNSNHALKEFVKNPHKDVNENDTVSYVSFISFLDGIPKAVHIIKEKIKK